MAERRAVPFVQPNRHWQNRGADPYANEAKEERDKKKGQYTCANPL